MNNILFVGLDVHKATIAVAVAEVDAAGKSANSATFSIIPITSANWLSAWRKAADPCNSATRPGHAAMAFIVTWWPLATNARWWRRAHLTFPALKAGERVEDRLAGTR